MCFKNVNVMILKDDINKNHIKKDCQQNIVKKKQSFAQKLN